MRQTTRAPLETQAMAELKDFNLDKWWNLLAAAGVLITGSGVAVRMMPVILIGVGFVLVGVGESANHPRWTDIKGPPLRKVTYYPRKPKPAGWFFDAIGAASFLVGLLMIVFPRLAP